MLGSPPIWEPSYGHPDEDKSQELHMALEGQPPPNPSPKTKEHLACAWKGKASVAKRQRFLQLTYKNISIFL